VTSSLDGSRRTAWPGLAAGVVRRNQGRLVAVAKFTRLDEVAAHEKVVRAAVETGLSAPLGYQMDGLRSVQSTVDASAIVLLAELLDAGSAGVEVDDLVEMTQYLVTENFSGLAAIVQCLIPVWLGTQLERLEQLGVITLADTEEVCLECDEPHWIARLTAAGVPVAIERVQELGIPVYSR
jgi:hypothetical protein